jgi:hypothetical protein
MNLTYNERHESYPAMRASRSSMRNAAEGGAYSTPDEP